MRISYQITRQDFIDAQLLHRKRQSFVRWMTVAMVGVAFLGVLGWVFARDPRMREQLFPLLVLPGVWLLAFWVLPYLIWVRVYEKDRRFQGQFEAEISEEGISIKSSFSDSSLYWNAFTRFLESNTIFLLYQSGQLFVLFPKRAFGLGEADQFRELARKKIALA